MTLQAKFPATDVQIASSIGASIDSVPNSLYRQCGKRLIDLALVLLALPLVLPVVTVLAACIALDRANPVFVQKRIGKDGKVFRMLKLRTMVPDAEARLEAHLDLDPAAAREWERTQKLRHDPRVTWVGRFLRKTSLDELPQLWNVLVGDMSLVGPRPMMESQMPLYPGSAYYDVRPGLTGPWQISARNEAEFASRATYDTRYSETLSLGADIGILLRTVTVVIRATGY
ncbi:lipopolysaccharide/colanic/teichoic acid biosynthesis glycosyltransferase [Aliiruegeria haliotis]|uniref:Lipopolysaccharide/colanic/teichoic acid biosynthesis glycosyltransferase n=1 Tax=Aliiruegeria haliotis TaxID=1280846 RepID=A0A2T0RFC7_9RHOB|nr:sugar transferase [Aliiruegeria haliotis]PRY19847.1 lipopolysaccharide/colanic/teichoic acid biosynthesis glycosyltransferase [Aliiruegeria haliotis]